MAGGLGEYLAITRACCRNVSRALGYCSERGPRHDQIIARRNQSLDALILSVPLLDPEGQIAVDHGRNRARSAAEQNVFRRVKNVP
jgi:hypothetical protein